MSAEERPSGSDDIPVDWEVEDSSSIETSGHVRGLLTAVLAAAKAHLKNGRRWFKRKRHVTNCTP
jgi:hypothetical protein